MGLGLGQINYLITFYLQSLNLVKVTIIYNTVHLAYGYFNAVETTKGDCN